MVSLMSSEAHKTIVNVGTLGLLRSNGIFGRLATMPYLVEVSGTWGATEAADALEGAFLHMAEQVLGPVNRPRSEGPRFDALRKLLGQRAVDLNEWSDSTKRLKVTAGEWDRGEVETNLRQIEVIILALRSAKLRFSDSVGLNPTQQSGWDAKGRNDEGHWVLEAFVGADVRNKDKVEKDAKSLSKARDDFTPYFACRPSAWPWSKSNRPIPGAGTLMLVNDNYEEEGVRLLKLEPLK